MAEPERGCTGDSGQRYELGPGPWGLVAPLPAFGAIDKVITMAPLTNPLSQEGNNSYLPPKAVERVHKSTLI